MERPTAMYNVNETYGDSAGWNENVHVMIYEENYFDEKRRYKADQLKVRYAAVLVKSVGERLDTLPIFATIGNTPEQAMEEIVNYPVEMVRHSVLRVKKSYSVQSGTQEVRVDEIREMQKVQMQPAEA